VNRRRWILTIAAGVLLSGCGGGGSLIGGGGGQSGAVNVFLTDSFETDHSHVWTRVYRVDVSSLNGSSETVFNDSEGRLIDLKTLRDSSGERFAFLGRAGVSANVQTNIRVTIASTLQLFRTGETTGRETPLAASVPRDANNHAVLNFNLAASRNLVNDDLVIDFDLANFALVNNAIVPALREGNKSGLANRARHERQEYRGTVANLSGTSLSNYTFTLGNFTVATSADTVLFNAANTPNPTLANGKRVEVSGIFDTAARRISATRIKIKEANAPTDEAFVEGVPSDIAAGAGTFRVGAARVRNLVPAETRVAIATTGSTLFRSNSGAPLTSAEFFALLAESSGVEVEGTYDTTTKILTAARARIDDAQQPKRVEFTGTPLNILPAVRTFRVDSLTEADGFVPNGQPLTISTTGNTKFTDANGTTLTSDAFFTQLASANRVKVHGTLSQSNSVVALRAQLRASQ
jgi:hypothetical protein